MKGPMPMLLLAVCLGTCAAFAPAPALRPAPLRAGLGARSPLGGSAGGVRGGRVGISMMAEKKTFKSMEDMLENSDKPVLVDFYATWCGPCVLMGRELATLSTDPEIKDKLMVVKIDTEKYPVIATKYEIAALPTVVLFKNGAPVERFEGVVMAAQMKQLVLSKLA